jgi:signal transduction histidine kinase
MEERDQTLTLISVPAWTHTDEILVEQMLMDLLHNTSLYAPASSVVTLRVAANKGNSELASTGELLSNSSTSISISDAGSGPNRMWLERAGVKWQGQAPVNLLAESQVAHGTGLGLRFVARSMQLLGGSIHAEYLNNEKVNQGFSIILKWSVEVEPDWDEAAQVAPHFDADQRVSW